MSSLIGQKFQMKLIVTSVVALACVALISRAAPDSKSSSNLPVTQIQYGPTGVVDAHNLELQAAPAYGDLAHGAHGTFIKMPAGFVSPVHIHTADYWGVVISGVGANGPVRGTDVPLPVGSYWFQKRAANGTLRGAFPQMNASSSSTKQPNSTTSRTKPSNPSANRRSAPILTGGPWAGAGKSKNRESREGKCLDA